MKKLLVLGLVVVGLVGVTAGSVFAEQFVGRVVDYLMEMPPDGYHVEDHSTFIMVIEIDQGETESRLGYNQNLPDILEIRMLPNSPFVPLVVSAYEAQRLYTFFTSTNWSYNGEVLVLMKPYIINNKPPIVTNEQIYEEVRGSREELSGRIGVLEDSIINNQQEVLGKLDGIEMKQVVAEERLGEIRTELFSPTGVLKTITEKLDRIINQLRNAIIIRRGANRPRRP